MALTGRAPRSPGCLPLHCPPASDDWHRTCQAHFLVLISQARPGRGFQPDLGVRGLSWRQGVGLTLSAQELGPTGPRALAQAVPQDGSPEPVLAPLLLPGWF